MKRMIHVATGILLCMSPLFYSCEKDTLLPTPPEETPATATTTIYYIKAGSHYCEQNQTELMLDPVINATVLFDSSAIYTSVLADNQGDVNKLIGFSDGGTNHQDNSARLGWSWNGQKVVIYAYAYVNKTRVIKTVGMVDLNQPFSCSVKAEKDYYTFTVNKQSETIARYSAGYTGFHYKLFPYFGGDELAPHDIHIKITEQMVAHDSSSAK